MNNINQLKLSSLILNKAKEFGADIVGITSVGELKDSPSHKQASKISRLEIGKREQNLEPLEVKWPEDGKSVIVFGISHPETKPELDWWYGDHSPPGNQKLMKINKRLAEWVNTNFPKVNTYKLPYSVEQGGIFFKDAAVKAGLGCIGRSNLLVTPEYGPRVRFRAMIVSEDLVSTGPITYNPCTSCEGLCIKSCPQKAFYEGSYERFTCNIEMEENIKTSNKKTKKIFMNQQEKSFS
ncbi:hypothetical protein [Natranaerofaba carboxydovora]|uniref:hypothetical protein n=1 Tax=Natranaerofaba carboxydovora TaxID=2742683 RepID=UPI001F1431C8|nr:hypothetical protein [Natranaerofaba carboxydovora]UMZ74416.1 TIGR00276: epoxyqueuosine reductase [Natranaerofaba carboxydovora]